MKTIDLSKLKVKANILSDELTELDISKGLAQVIYANTAQITEHKFAYKLLDNPVVELMEENKRLIREYVSIGYLAYVQIAINEILDETK